MQSCKNIELNYAQITVVNIKNLPLTVRIEVKEVTPHFPTVAADLAADGRLVFSLKRFSNWKVACELPPLRYFPYPRDIFKKQLT